MSYSASILVAAALAATLAVSPAQANSDGTPHRLEGAKTISIEEAKQMMKDAVIVDARTQGAYSAERLPGARTITSYYNPDQRTFHAAIYGPDKSAPIIVYGENDASWKAVFAVNCVVAAGYTNVHWLRAGLEGWTAEKLPVER